MTNAQAAFKLQRNFAPTICGSIRAKPFLNKSSATAKECCLQKVMIYEETVTVTDLPLSWVRGKKVPI